MKEIKSIENTADKRKTIDNTLGFARWLLVAGVLVIIIMPFLLTGEYFHKRFNFSDTGQIGDTIGGITAPFLNLIGAILVFYALKAQVKANEIIQDQINDETQGKIIEDEGKNLNQLYSYLNESINSFKFKTLSIVHLKNVDNIDTDIEFSGGAAFYHLFSQIQCHFHGTQEELHNDQSVSELLSVLKIMDLLLTKLDSTNSRNKEIIMTLVKHLFEYKIITRVKQISDENLEVTYCPSCECNHGLPEDLKNLIVGIRKKIS